MARAEVVVCGAGIGGVAAAYELAVARGVGPVVIVDPLPPLTLTSDKSTECYRNWWPSAAMVALMNRSVERLDEWTVRSGDRFALNRNGYLYVTADRGRAAALAREAEETSARGAGPLRVHSGAGVATGYRAPRWDRPDPDADGADLFATPELVRARWPFLAGDVVAGLHARRCGWLSAQQLGMWLLEQARAAGARLIEGRVVGVETDAAGVAAVAVARGGAVERVATRTLVDAAGPHAAAVARLAGVELPLACELHGKVYFEDTLGTVPRELPLTIGIDPVRLAWTTEERAALGADPELAWLLEPLSGGVHFRPEGGAGSRMLLLLWTYHTETVEPRWPLAFDSFYPEVVVRGVARWVPDFAAYLPLARPPFVDGGYYTKTPENRFLVGPTPVPGFHLMCGLSGYGIMGAPAAAELLGAHLTGGALPGYASDLLLARYEDPIYRARLTQGDLTSGQL
jgi:glycine/D-amino acid oxidase-like deaminating enzyme